MSPFDLTPQPGESVDWSAVESQLPWFATMIGVEQSPRYHAEGDVHTHVKMVVDDLVASPAWAERDPDSRADLFVAALFHDLGKVYCTRREDDGSITSRGHAERGSVLARQELWRCGVPFERRERVCAVVRWHMLPFHLVSRSEANRLSYRVAETVRWEDVLTHATSDARGRICDDLDDILDRVQLAREWVEAAGCAAKNYGFPDDHARVLYFRGDRAHPDVPTWEPRRLTVTLLSGLPGAGKDRWIERERGHSPVVSLDRIRARLKVDPTDNQGRVVQAAREAAREHLRDGRDFVWNATHLSRRLRSLSISLCLQYGARVEIVYVESPASRLFAQNRRRPDAVPEGAIDRLLRRWEVPDRTEAHAVQFVTGD